MGNLKLATFGDWCVRDTTFACSERVTRFGKSGLQVGQLWSSYLILGGSWVVISRVISRITLAITYIKGTYN